MLDFLNLFGREGASWLISMGIISLPVNLVLIIVLLKIWSIYRKNKAATNTPEPKKEKELIYSINDNLDLIFERFEDGLWRARMRIGNQVSDLDVGRSEKIGSLLWRCLNHLNIDPSPSEMMGK